MRINKIAAATLLSVVSAGSVMLATTTPAGALGFATASVTPSTNLVQGQVVTVKASGFPAADAGKTMYTLECASQALTTLDVSYCDSNPADVNNTGVFSSTLVNGKAVGQVSFTVLTGSHFRPANTAGKCAFNSNSTAASNVCYITVSDTMTQTDGTTVGLGGKIQFADPRTATKTTLKAPKKVTAGKTIKISVSVTKGATGKVTVVDGTKTIAKKVKVPASGKIKVKEKKAAKGKHKFAAAYSGDKTFAPSVSKVVTTKVK